LHILKKYAVLAVKLQPRFWLLPCGFGAVAVLFFSNVVNRGLQKMTPRRALKVTRFYTTELVLYDFGYFTESPFTRPYEQLEQRRRVQISNWF